MAEEPLSPKPSLAPSQRAPAAANRLQSPTSPFFLGSNDDQLERARARAARAAANRRIAATTNTSSPPPDPCLSKEQIVDLFHNCIKLASENVRSLSYFFFFNILFVIGFGETQSSNKFSLTKAKTIKEI